ncbi:guanyl-specific ribonuclease Sa [Pseudoxanthomonas sp. OG2]|uniref:ribonuclease domain-containing protein n=1 Tax=Pseudoxanthomonas beigongshangi TaxID=2782537 RepID=UPI0018397DE5|nr:guanyl-specific ribonuclease Sa [Pseudoxanthomonas sp. OG2]MBV7475666.1 ribonuclease [Pseudoxanthomonas sp. PXM05]
MPRRSRHRSGFRKPAIIITVLLLLVAGWFWQQQRARHDAVGEAPPSIAADAGGPGARAELPLPPIESTRVDAAATAPAVPPPPAPSASPAPASGDAQAGLPAFLPPEAHRTLALIARGGPFPNRQDGSVFGNREGRLPARQRGYYREYTVDTPGLDHRGARRIVTGGQPPVEYYYTDDHYETFRRFDVPAQVNR